jgi:hypothetical protein
MRNFINVYSADGVIVVGGGAGTLTEIAAAYIEGKPIVALRGSGGVADEYAGRYLDQRKTVLIHAADTPSEAVELVLRLITERASTGTNGKSGTSVLWTRLGYSRLRLRCVSSSYFLYFSMIGHQSLSGQ